ncbi:hypothetical protein D3C87_1403630 [compost metagenome]
MECVIQVQPLAGHAPLLQGGFQARKRRRIAGNGRAAGTVVARHDQLARQAQFRQQRLGAAAVHADGGHLAAAAGLALQSAAVMDHLHRIGQRQCATCPRRGDFAHAVAHDRKRLDA